MQIHAKKPACECKIRSAQIHHQILYINRSNLINLGFAPFPTFFWFFQVLPKLRTQKCNISDALQAHAYCGIPLYLLWSLSVRAGLGTCRRSVWNSSTYCQGFTLQHCQPTAVPPVFSVPSICLTLKSLDLQKTNQVFSRTRIGN